MRITFKSRMTKAFYVFIDILCGYACILAACLLRQKSLPFQLTFHNIVISEENPFRIIFVLWVLLVIVLANIHRLYQTRRDTFEGFEIWQVFKTVVLHNFRIRIYCFNFGVIQGNEFLYGKENSVYYHC